MPRKIRTGLIMLLLAMGLLPIPASAQSSGGEFVLTNSSIDNGGGESGSGDFALIGTVGNLMFKDSFEVSAVNAELTPSGLKRPSVQSDPLTGILR